MQGIIVLGDGQVRVPAFHGLPDICRTLGIQTVTRNPLPVPS